MPFLYPEQQRALQASQITERELPPSPMPVQAIPAYAPNADAQMASLAREVVAAHQPVASTGGWVAPVARERAVANPYYTPAGGFQAYQQTGLTPPIMQSNPYATAAYGVGPDGSVSALVGFPSRYPHILNVGLRDYMAPLNNYMAAFNQQALDLLRARGGVGGGMSGGIRGGGGMPPVAPASRDLSLYPGAEAPEPSRQRAQDIQQHGVRDRYGMPSDDLSQLSSEELDALVEMARRDVLNGEPSDFSSMIDKYRQGNVVAADEFLRPGTFIDGYDNLQSNLEDAIALSLPGVGKYDVSSRPSPFGVRRTAEAAPAPATGDLPALALSGNAPSVPRAAYYSGDKDSALANTLATSGLTAAGLAGLAYGINKPTAAEAYAKRNGIGFNEAAWNNAKAAAASDSAQINSKVRARQIAQARMQNAAKPVTSPPAYTPSGVTPAQAQENYMRDYAARRAARGTGRTMRANALGLLPTIALAIQGAAQNPENTVAQNMAYAFGFDPASTRAAAASEYQRALSSGQFQVEADGAIVLPTSNGPVALYPDGTARATTEWR